MTATFTWALRIPLAEASTLSALRIWPGVHVAVTGEELWVAGRDITPGLDVRLRQLPATARYEVTPQNVLRIPGERLSSGRLPETSWTPLLKWIVPALPPVALPGTGTATASLTLIRAEQTANASLLLTRLSVFQAYAETAPQVRLQRLEFAAAPDGRCLIRGTPLPALPGEHWIDHGGFATPAGFNWTPPLAAKLVHEWLAIDSGEFVLWHPDQTFVRITEEQWTRAERSAVRLSGEMNHV